MPASEHNPLVRTIGERCRMCYACVRECPAKAIRVRDGQAEVIQERCIGCGNCVLVCSQNAKEIHDETGRVVELLETRTDVAAIVAPSFPAEFIDIGAGRMVSLLRALGFASVHDVAFGADLVAREYQRLLSEQPDGRYITTPCPAVVNYVRKYFPDMIDFLAPVVSPMLAEARVVRRLHGADTPVVFIGPCIAKKGESPIAETDGEINAVLTFAELRRLFEERGLDSSTADPQGRFDPPDGGVGAVFPISGGLLQAAGLEEDLVAGALVVAEGRSEFIEAIADFEESQDSTRLLDVLSCQGCAAGVGITRDDTYLARRLNISRYARHRLRDFDQAAWEAAMDAFDGMDLSRTFTTADVCIDDLASPEELHEVLVRMGKQSEADYLDCGACGYDTCLDHARAVYAGLADSDMCLPHTIEQLRAAFHDLEESHRSLETTREALVKSEKLASMGQLAAGIAHEVNNPLGILLLQANILLEECQQREAEGNGDPEMREDLGLIVDQANRCKRIISGLLNFARQSRVVRQPTDLVQLVEDTVHTLPVVEDVEIEVENTMKAPIAEIDKDQMVQVLVNLISNAQHAMPEGGRIVVRLWDEPDKVMFSISDNGSGIAVENMEKLFDPFFTTKQVGMGTGLGLAVTHGIIKMHRGQITVASNADPSKGPTETTFTITLPRTEA